MILCNIHSSNSEINRLGHLWIEYDHSQTLQGRQRPGWAAWAGGWARLPFPHRACSVCGHGNGTQIWLAVIRQSAPRSKERSWRMPLLAAKKEEKEKESLGYGKGGTGEDYAGRNPSTFTAWIPSWIIHANSIRHIVVQKYLNTQAKLKNAWMPWNNKIKHLFEKNV